MEKIDESSISSTVSRAEVTGGQVRGRLRLSWINDLKFALGSREMPAESSLLSS